MFTFIFGTAAVVVVGLLVRTAVNNEQLNHLLNEKLGY